MPDPGLITSTDLNNWWSLILKMDAPTLVMHASALDHLHGCEVYLGLKALPEIQSPMPFLTEIGAKKSSFKNLEQADVPVLRYWLDHTENIQLINDWAETILRYCEINQSSLLKKARVQFRSGSQSASNARLTLLEMSAFLLDLYFERQDLRFLNIVLKLIELSGLFSKRTIAKDLDGNLNQVSIDLLQIRIMIMSEAALRQLKNGTA
jgi:hypothetical protein